ncbi:MAG: hypothetical protein LAO04_02735 [Acidobacteriia bacterium]|nr:hypothetical protein [Terriglobia bacterium]
MGMLTEDMTRLRDEILALRSSRQGLIHDLARETEKRRADVSSMLANTSEALSAVAKATKADRLGSIADLKSAVADILSGVSTDLCGIRQVWLASGTPARWAGGECGKQTRQVAAADSKGSRSVTGRKPAPVRKKR